MNNGEVFAGDQITELDCLEPEIGDMRLLRTSRVQMDRIENCAAQVQQVKRHRLRTLVLGGDK